MKFILKKWWFWLSAGIILIVGGYFILIQLGIQADSATIVGKADPTTINVAAEPKTTNLGFTLYSSKWYVRVFVKDSSGKWVKSVRNYGSTPLNAGTYTKSNLSELFWNGKNDSGSTVAPGTYTVTFDAKSSLYNIYTKRSTVKVTVLNNATSGTSIMTVSPMSFNPSTNGSAGIKIDIKTAGTYQLLVKNSSNITVKTIIGFNTVPVGIYTKTWDGKNASGITVPAGDYTIINEQKKTDGTIVTSSTAKVVVTGSTEGDDGTGDEGGTGDGGGTGGGDTGGGIIPDGNELGNTLEGIFSANFDWFQRPKNKFGISFKADRTAKLSSITMQWKSSYGYGYGAKNTEAGHTVSYAKSEHGVYKFEIQTNGSNNYPSGTAIATVNNIYPEDGLAKAKGRTVTNPNTEMAILDGAMQVDFSGQPQLEAGKIYHLVITNTGYNSPTGYDVTKNWSSPNTLVSRVQQGWTGGNRRSEYFDGTKWQPWTTWKNRWQPDPQNAVNTVDGGHAPMLIGWSDGQSTGDSYYSAASQKRHPALYGSYYAGEQINWTTDTTAIKKIGLSVYKSNWTARPADNVYYHIDKLSGSSVTSLKSGIFMTPVDADKITIAHFSKDPDWDGPVPTWFYKDLTGVNFEKGQTYRIWFDSPKSTSSSFIEMAPIYSQAGIGNWWKNTWGGSSSFAYMSSPNSGGRKEFTDMDLSLSIQK